MREKHYSFTKSTAEVVQATVATHGVASLWPGSTHEVIADGYKNNVKALFGYTSNHYNPCALEFKFHSNPLQRIWIEIDTCTFRQALSRFHIFFKLKQTT